MSTCATFHAPLALIAALCAVALCLAQDPCSQHSDCPANAICVKNADPSPAECICDTGYLLVTPGPISCILIKGYECEIVGHCLESTYFCDTALSPSKCTCSPNSYFNPELDECTPTPTHIYDPCAQDSDCASVANSVCVLSDGDGGTVGVCACAAGWFLTSRGETPVCQSLPQVVGGPCEYDEHCEAAVENSVCREREDGSGATAWGRCQCADGYGGEDGTEDCTEIISSSTPATDPPSSGAPTSSTAETATTLEPTNSEALATTPAPTSGDPGSTTTTRTTITTTTPTPDLPRNESITCTAFDEFGTVWRAMGGETGRRLCPGRDSGFATWACGLGGEFIGQGPSYADCSTVWVGQLAGEIEEALKSGPLNISQSEFFFESLHTFVDEALTFGTLNPDENGEAQFFGHEIGTILGLAAKLAENVVDEDSSVEGLELVAQNSLAVTNSLLGFGKSWVQLPQRDRTDTFGAAIGTIESSALHLTRAVAESGEGYGKSFGESTFSAQTGLASEGSALGFPANSKGVAGRDSFIKLPARWRDFVPPGDGDGEGGTSFVGMEMSAGVVAGNVADKILEGGQELDTSRALNSPMLSFSFGPAEHIDFESEEVEVTFQMEEGSWGDEPKKFRRALHPGERPASVGSALGQTCAYFDRKLGTWSTSGCRLVSDGPFGVTCACNHLSAFGLLSKFHEYVGKSLPLQLVQTLGPGLPALLLVAQVYQSPPSLFRWRSVQESTKFLMILFMLGNLIVVLLIDRHCFWLGTGACYAIGFFSHLLFLTYFTFSLVLSLDTFLEIACQCQARGSASHGKGKDVVPISGFAAKVRRFSYWIYGAIGIVVPVLTVGFTAIVGAAMGPNTRAYGSQFCWLDGPYIWAFYGPATFMFALNLVLVGYIKMRLTPSPPVPSPEPAVPSPASPTQNSPMAEEEERQSALAINLRFSILFFLTWWIAFYQFGPSLGDSSLLDFAFPFLNAVQGLMMRMVCVNEGSGVRACQEPQGGSGGAASTFFSFINPFNTGLQSVQAGGFLDGAKLPKLPGQITDLTIVPDELEMGGGDQNTEETEGTARSSNEGPRGSRTPGQVESGSSQRPRSTMGGGVRNRLIQLVHNGPESLA